MDTSIFKFDKFKGINNVKDPIKLSSNELKIATNIDITDDRIIKRRDGCILLYGGDIHSIKGIGGLLLFVEGNKLKYLKEDNTSTILATVTANIHMVYETDGVSKIFYTNGIEIGYIDTISLSSGLFTNPNIKYRRPIKAGHMMSFEVGRLLVARGNQVEVSIGLTPTLMDERNGILQFDSYITLLAGVHDGFYIADNNTYFVTVNEKNEWDRKPVANYGAIPFTNVKIDTNAVGDTDIAGKVGIMWDSIKGKCIGTNGGVFKNYTERFYIPVNSGTGSSAFRNDDGMHQHISLISN